MLEALDIICAGGFPLGSFGFVPMFVWLFRR